LIELLLAATVTSITAAAGAAFIGAISDASLTTREVSAAKAEGHYAMMQIGRAIRQARSIGQVTSSAVTLWLQDANNDDKTNLYEAGIIRYDSVNQQIVYDYLQQPATPVTTTLTRSTLIDATSLQTTMPTADKKTLVWAKGVTSCSFTGNPSLTDTRLVQVSFTINYNGQSVPFMTAMGPRGAGDYLFYAETISPAPLGSIRKARKYFSRWTGFGDVANASNAIDAM
jgi:hypothetical protein